MEKNEKSSKEETLHGKCFPGESPEYRRARNELLRAESELRRRSEEVAALRRKLPPGGLVPENYVFEEATEDGGTREVKISDLFSPGKDTLLIYSFMYGPNESKPCGACASILDSLDGTVPHTEQRVNLVAVAKSPLPRILDFSRKRGWRHLRILSSANNHYNRDYLAENPDGSQMPILNVFRKDTEGIRHFWGSELLYYPDEEGRERHVDFIWPIWNLLDVTPEGRGTAWDFPKLSYGPE
ncbi:uncharacterized protein VTP21DRAFT_8157 [Calcarisporiella thermophila]|uniref:uncharacterized protein n=1 Tax=Calcarisporiella thermophila TaxID=911321 RepID=UPI0037428A5F